MLKKLRHKYPRLHIIYADEGYAGKLVEYVADTFNWVLSIIKRSDKQKFVVLPERWIVAAAARNGLLPGWTITEDSQKITKD